MSRVLSNLEYKPRLKHVELVRLPSKDLVDGMRKRWGLDGSGSSQYLIKVVPWSGQFPVLVRAPTDDLEDVIRDVASWFDEEELKQLNRPPGEGDESMDLEYVIRDVASWFDEEELKQLGVSDVEWLEDIPKIWQQDTLWEPNYDIESEQQNYQPPYSTSRKWSAWKPEPKKVDYEYLPTGPDTFEKVTIADVDPWDNLWSLGPAFWEKMKDDQPNKPKVWSSGRDPSQPFEPKK